VREQTPALAVVDVTLPGMDGTAVSAALRAVLGTRFPIVLISADVGLREKAAKVGAAAYLLKPFGVDELIAAVNASLSPA
jgi:DNA-binding response OmpR family regulator